MSDVNRPYGGVPTSQRRDHRRRRLIEACLELVGSHGISAVSAESVAAEAKLTKRYFYESFADREALLVAALDEFLVELFEQIYKAMALSVEDIVDLFVSILCADPRRARLYAESAGLPALQARREVAITTFTDLVTANDPDDRPAELVKRQLMTRIVVVGLTETVTSWINGGLPTADRQTLTSAITTLAKAIGRGNRPSTS